MLFIVSSQFKRIPGSAEPYCCQMKVNIARNSVLEFRKIQIPAFVLGCQEIDSPLTKPPLTGEFSFFSEI